MGDSKNVALLTVDALRADHLSCHGYQRETSPNLDRFAQENTHFTNAVSASSFTREAVGALLSGKYPADAVNAKYELDSDTIATYLKEAGYATGAVHSNPYVSRGYGYDRDFELFDDDLRMSQNKFVALAQRAFDKLRNRNYAPAEVINERALDWIDSVDQPFFLWAHYMDPHGPYDPPDKYAERFHGSTVNSREQQRLYRRAAITDPKGITETERQRMIDLYDGEIRYTDDQIGVFLNGLEERGLLEDTLIIVTADHGDAFGEHGYYGHPRQLDDELVDVPLLAGGAGIDTGEVDVPTSTLDVVPTILDAAGVDGADLPGESLFEVVVDSEAYRDRVVFSQARGDSRYDEEYLRRFRAQTLETSARIEREIESAQILSSDGDDQELLEALTEHSASALDDSSGSVVKESTSKDVDRRLKALGYKE